MAAAAFICDALFLIEFVWDVIHRIVRDIKGALNSACGGIFLKAQIYSSHVWTLNMKPFGSKTCGTMKRRIMSSFLMCENYEGALFNKYCGRIGSVLGLPCNTPDQKKAVWEALSNFRSKDQGSELPRCQQLSFQCTPTLPKGDDGDHGDHDGDDGDDDGGDDDDGDDDGGGDCCRW